MGDFGRVSGKIIGIKEYFYEMDSFNDDFYVFGVECNGS